MSEHTPGSWSVLLHSEGEQVLNVIAGEPTYTGTGAKAKWIAELDDSSLEGEYGENEANARLIAAAPDLLEACRIAMGSVQEDATRLIIKAAIDKATGGNQ